MGYTHYMKVHRAPTSEEWARFKGLARAIVDLCGVPLTDWDRDGSGEPEINGERVSFNGVGREGGHETCLIERAATGFSFCKTECKPYDKVVGAVYLAYRECAGCVELSSDGDMDGEEWRAARELFAAASGRIELENGASGMVYLVVAQPGERAYEVFATQERAERWVAERRASAKVLDVRFAVRPMEVVR